MSPTPRLSELAVQHLAAGGGLGITGSGAGLVGALGFVYLIAKWKHLSSEVRKYLVIGFITAALLSASTSGMIGGVMKGIRDTGDGVGSSVSTNP